MTGGDEGDVARLPSGIAAPVDDELVVKRSRFLTRVEPVATLADAEAVIAEARRRHWDARHHCTALVVGDRGDRQRSSDGGEPAGTAGVPMLEVLRRRDLTGVVAVVSRYFGGVKLGAGGLVRAYSGAVAQALDLAVTVTRTPAVRVTVDVPHPEAGRVQGLLRQWAEDHECAVEGVGYAEVARIALLVPPARLAALDAAVAAAGAGRLLAERGDAVVLER